MTSLYQITECWTCAVARVCQRAVTCRKTDCTMNAVPGFSDVPSAYKVTCQFALMSYHIIFWSLVP